MTLLNGGAAASAREPRPDRPGAQAIARSGHPARLRAALWRTPDGEMSSEAARGEETTLPQVFEAVEAFPGLRAWGKSLDCGWLTTGRLCRPADSIPDGTAAQSKAPRRTPMPSRQVSIPALFALVASLLLLCSEAAAQNRPPVADAGEDQEIFVGEFTGLQGSAWDPEGGFIVG